LGYLYTPFRPRKARYWEAKQAEDRTQTFNATDTNQAAYPQDDLFFKTKQMHDIVIGLFVNRYEFGVAV